MIRHKKFLFLFLATMLHFMAYTQTGNYSPMPLSGSNAVSSNTGSPNVSVPLWTVEGKELKVPVVAVYASKGFGVNQVPGVIGNSWELLAGGYIVQQTMGGNDLGEYGFKSIGCTVYEQDTSFCQEVAENIIDGEPDIFTYSFPGGAGNFVYGSDGQFVNIQKSNYKIKYFDFKFEIIDDYGTKYFFDILETTRFYLPGEEHPVEGNNAYKWMLTRMISANSVDTINFEYFTNYYSSGEISNYNCFTAQSNYDWSSGDFSTHKFDIQKRNLKKISSSQGYIQFIYIDDSQTEHFELLQDEFLYGNKITNTLPDPHPNLTNDINTLKSIDCFNEQGKLVKSYTFKYLFPNNRVLLNEIQEVSPSAEKMPPYRFSYYNTPNLPEIFASFQNDYGGFHGRKYELYPPSLSKPSNVLYLFPNSNSKNGMLYEVFYPGGAMLHFEYEQNSFCIPDEQYDPRWYILPEDRINVPGAGVRVKKIIESDGNNQQITEFEYLDESGNSSGRITDFPVSEFRFDFTYSKYGVPTTEVFFVKSSNLMNLYSPDIYYEHITTYIGGKNGTNKGVLGKVINNYLIEQSSTLLWLKHNSTEPDFHLSFYYPLMVSIDKEHSLPLWSRTYDAQNNIKSESLNKFLLENTGKTSKGIKSIQNNAITNRHKTEIYTINQRLVKIDSTINIVYDDNGHAERSYTKFIYSKGADTSLYPLIIQSETSTGEKMEKHVIYPYSSPSAGPDYLVLGQMKNSFNIHALPVGEEIYKNNLRISGKKTIFNDSTGRIPFLPKSVSLIDSGVYVEKLFFDRFNQNGKLTQSHGTDGVYSSMIYGHKGSLPIAEISNAKLEEVFHTSFEDTTLNGIVLNDAKTGDRSFNGTFEIPMTGNVNGLILSYWKKNGQAWEYFEKEMASSADLSLSGHIDEVRVHPATAFMSTKTWNLLAGISSVTDANGRSLYSEYDAFGRIIKQKDQDRILRSEMNYNSIDRIGQFNYSISGPDSIAIGCNAALQIEASGNGISGWQWFNDYCNGTLVGSGTSFSAGLGQNEIPASFPNDGFEIKKTFYAKPIVEGQCMPCVEKAVRYQLPVFNNEENVIYFTYAGKSDSVINLQYSGCNDDWTITQPLNSWVTAEKQGGVLHLSCTVNTGTTERVQSIEIRTPSNPLEVKTFQIRQGQLLNLSVTGVTSTSSATITATPSGGKAPYTFSWKVNGQPLAQTSNTISLNYGYVYQINCQVTDSYQLNQNASKTISYSAIIPLVLTKTISFPRNKINMSVYASGGKPGYTYEWWDNSTRLTNQSSNLYTDFIAGHRYCCKVTDSGPNGGQSVWICSDGGGGPIELID